MKEEVEVYKFGGTSVGSPQRMEAVASLILGQGVPTGGLVVVASAMSKVTDALVRLCRLAVDGERAALDDALAELLARHIRALESVCVPGPSLVAVSAELEELVAELGALLQAGILLGELGPRTRDRIMATGEKLSVRLLAAALRKAGFDALCLDADTFLETDDNYGEANPLHGLADRTIQAALEPLLREGKLPVVTGFCGQAPDGSTTTMGRGGSDLTATVIAGALDAHRVTLWSDVDGVYSANPKVVPEARVIPQLNFREAAEMSYYGAKVLHQRTMIPVSGKRIPVWSRNSMRPQAPGTVVDGRFTPGSHPVKAISAIGGHCLIAVEGKGMSGVPGVAARVFTALASKKISVTMISQSSSEASICLAVPEADSMAAEAALKAAFRTDLTLGNVEEIIVRRGVGLVAAVGLGMAHMPGVAAKVMNALGGSGLNILAIAQGSSELNISVAVPEEDAQEAVRSIHQAFGLHRADTGEDTSACLDLMLLGCGSIGRALMGLVQARRHEVLDRFGLELRIVAVADSSGYLLQPKGMGGDVLEGIAAHKSAGGRIAALEGGVMGSANEMVEQSLSWRLSRPVLVDISDTDDAHDVFETALGLGSDVVTANKKPLAGSLANFERLQAAAAGKGRLVKAETTVGAGLPVVDTLEMLLATGDRLHRAEGCLSGTLGFLMSKLEAGVPLSVAVGDAVELGYTEPDPVADLSGADVARKAVILGRLSGLVRSDDPVALTGLVPEQWAGLPLATLMERLETLDAPMAQKVRDAAARGEVLRYMAQVSDGSIEVGPVSVPADSPAGMLKGTDNMIVFHSDRYHLRPLVVTGPGAGVAVTAMGVLGDILRVAAQRSLS